MTRGRDSVVLVGLSLTLASVTFAFLFERGYLEDGAGTIGIAIGTAAALLGAITSNRSEQSEPDPRPPESTQPHLEARISEVRAAIRRQRVSERLSGISSAALTFSQYVVGAVLATSFVQQSLSNRTIGGLGVVVVFASVCHQRYRPDVIHRQAKARRARLAKALRQAEDQLFAISEKRDNAPSAIRVAQSLSRGLDELELGGLEEVEDEKPQ
jgi:hypothetical protein